MCRVTVVFTQGGQFESIHARYCDNHPACGTLKGDLVRSVIPAPSAPTAGSTTFSPGLRTSSLFANRLSAPSGSGSGTPSGSGSGTPSGSGAPSGSGTPGGSGSGAPSDSSDGAGAGSSSSAQAVSGVVQGAMESHQLHRPVRKPSLVRKGLTKLTSTSSSAGRGDKPQYGASARDFCILLCFVYLCGHAVKLEPPIRGWACGKEGCKHTKYSHFVTVPLEFPCMWVAPCNSSDSQRRAILYEVPKDGNTEPKVILKDLRADRGR